MELKNISRVVHLTSNMALSTFIIFNYLSSDELNKKVAVHQSYSTFWTLTSILVFASGIANIFLIKGKKLTDPVHKIWVHFFELKFVLSLFLTPLVYPMTGMFYASSSPTETVVIDEESDDIFDTQVMKAADHIPDSTRIAL